MSSPRNQRSAASGNRPADADVPLRNLSGSRENDTATTIDGRSDRLADEAFVENGNSEKDAANQLIPPFNPVISPGMNIEVSSLPDTMAGKGFGVLKFGSNKAWK